MVQIREQKWSNNQQFPFSKLPFTGELLITDKIPRPTVSDFSKQLKQEHEAAIIQKHNTM